MDQTQHLVHQKNVLHQIPPVIRTQVRTSLVVLEAKGSRGFQLRIAAHDACPDVLRAGHRTRLFLHRLLGRQVPVRSARLLHLRFDVLLDPLRDARRVIVELLQRDLPLVEKAFHSSGIAHRQVTPKNHAIEAG